MKWVKYTTEVSLEHTVSMYLLTHFFNCLSLQACNFSNDWIIQRQPCIRITATEKVYIRPFKHYRVFLSALCYCQIVSTHNPLKRTVKVKRCSYKKWNYFHNDLRHCSLKPHPLYPLYYSLPSSSDRSVLALVTHEVTQAFANNKRKSPILW